MNNGGIPRCGTGSRLFTASQAEKRTAKLVSLFSIQNQKNKSPSDIIPQIFISLLVEGEDTAVSTSRLEIMDSEIRVVGSGRGGGVEQDCVMCDRSASPVSCITWSGDCGIPKLRNRANSVWVDCVIRNLDSAYSAWKHRRTASFLG